MNIWERLRNAGRRWLPCASAAIPVPDGWIVERRSAQDCYLLSPDQSASLSVRFHVAEVPASENPCRDLLETGLPTGATIKDLGRGRSVGIYQSDPEDDDVTYHWQLVRQVSRTKVEILHYELEMNAEVEEQRRARLLRDVESCVRGSQW
jgi:hypothetical protein